MTDRSIAGAIGEEAEMEPIDYRALVEEFEDALVTKLRGHSTGKDFLALWVPDADPLKSLLNMIDAAQGAGLGGIAIKLPAGLMPRERLELLLGEGGDAGAVTWDEDALILRVTGRKGQSSPWIRYPASLNRIDPAPSARELASQPQQASLPDSPDQQLVPDAFRQALLDAAMSPVRDGVLQNDSAGLRLETTAGAVTLSILADPRTHRIRFARHHGTTAPVERGVFEVFCALIEGLPIQEASDYGGFKLLDRLRGDCRRPVAGIMLPANAGPLLLKPVRMVRDLRQQYADRTGFRNIANFYEAPPSKDWIALDHAGKVQQLHAALADFRESRKLGCGDVVFIRLTENKFHFPLRVWIGFSQDISHEIKPALTMAAERWLKRYVEDKLQVFNEEARDESPLRRMSPNDAKHR